MGILPECRTDHEPLALRPCFTGYVTSSITGTLQRDGNLHGLGFLLKLLHRIFLLLPVQKCDYQLTYYSLDLWRPHEPRIGA